MTLEIELPLLRAIDVAYVHKLKQLLLIIAESVPFIPNISKLSERIGINRITLLGYLQYLQEAHLISSLYKDAKGISRLQKSDKLYLENTNFIYALTPQNVNIGNVRETFFYNQLLLDNTIEYPEQADFIVNIKYTFEIGGQNKKTKQVKQIKNSYTVVDDIEFATGNRIPLWMFGFLY